jgi:hypothetical protein
MRLMIVQLVAMLLDVDLWAHYGYEVRYNRPFLGFTGGMEEEEPQ